MQKKKQKYVFAPADINHAFVANATNAIILGMPQYTYVVWLLCHQAKAALVQQHQSSSHLGHKTKTEYNH